MVAISLLPAVHLPDGAPSLLLDCELLLAVLVRHAPRPVKLQSGWLGDRPLGFITLGANRHTRRAAPVSLLGLKLHDRDVQLFGNLLAERVFNLIQLHFVRPASVLQDLLQKELLPVVAAQETDSLVAIAILLTHVMQEPGPAPLIHAEAFKVKLSRTVKAGLLLVLALTPLQTFLRAVVNILDHCDVQSLGLQLRVRFHPLRRLVRIQALALACVRAVGCGHGHDEPLIIDCLGLFGVELVLQLPVARQGAPVGTFLQRAKLLLVIQICELDLVLAQVRFDKFHLLQEANAGCLGRLVVFDALA
mmetsp:Transcript_78519/g.182183  ORF Transcript_78519/g.182183 Transcript_78519/m.182183 type:complete len:305 (+) Transcript_78519:296-1210(+)